MKGKKKKGGAVRSPTYKDEEQWGPT